MLKVFLVDDESIIREGLRDNIPWQQFGYEFVGEASDGEMALPMIRKLKPDVLITDIKMPFMDGLALSRMVTQEFPNIRIVSISGYDEFEYAQQAIRLGVEQYLLKPITRSSLQKVLSEIREKIEAEQEQKNYLEKFQNEMQEYEQYTRRNFLEKVFEGQLSVQQIYEEAGKLSINLDGPCYNLVLLNLQEKKRSNWVKEMDHVDGVEEDLLRYFLRFPEYMPFTWSINVYGILIKGESQDMQGYLERCMDNIERICGEYEYFVDWHVAAGDVVERLSQLPDCYAKANHLLAYRFLMPGEHVLKSTEVVEVSSGINSGNIAKLDIAKVDPEIIKGFLAEGEPEEIDDFIKGYLLGLKEALQSKLFRDYMFLSIRFTTLAYVETLGVKQDDFLESVGTERLDALSGGAGDIENYMKILLQGAIEIRENESANQSKHILKRALEYIEENYCQETLSLNSVSSTIDVSANYFSGIFSQEMGQTFIEYVTQKRMEKAKKLLRQTELHSGEIAAAVGYKDSHYFSFVFKKTQGCTPREYRNSK